MCKSVGKLTGNTDHLRLLSMAPKRRLLKLPIGAGQQRMTIPQTGFVPPARIPQRINWQPQKRYLYFSKMSFSRV